MVTPEKVRDLYESGKLEEARSLAQQRATQSIKDAVIHISWANLLEELQLYDDVLVELNLAARDDPGNPETCHRLADIYIDNGDYIKAARIMWSMVEKEPKNIDYYREIGRILEQGGQYEKVLKVYQIGYDNTGAEIFKKLISSLEFLKKDSSVTETIEEKDQIVPAQHHLVTFTSLFAGREGVYARQWASPTGETGYTPVQEPLTLKVAENHILGNLTAGVYPVRMDNTVNFIAFDLDLPKFILNKVISSESQWKKAMERLHKVSCQLIDLGASQDIPIYLEDSGFKGRHCWIFLEMPTSAGIAKRLGELLLGQMKQKTPDVAIEIFPKQGIVKKGSLGNLIKLPLGFHRKTGKRSIFLRPDGKTVESQLEFLENVEKASRQSIYTVIQRLQVKYSVPEIIPKEIKEKQKVAVAKPVYNYNLETDIQVQYLLLKCQVIRQIVQRINQSASLTTNETVVLSHTIGHLENGPEAVNHLLRRCVNINPSHFLKSRLKGNPISCPKIRARIPEITSSVSCNCRFDPSISHYPTPLVHIYSKSSQGLTAEVGMTAGSMQFQSMVQEYLSLRRQMSEIEVIVKKFEDRFHAFFDEIGTDSVDTPLGRLRLIKNDENKITFMLEMDSR